MKRFIIPIIIIIFIIFNCGGKKKGFLPILGLVALSEDGSSSGQTTENGVAASSVSTTSGLEENVQVSSTLTNSQSVAYTTNITGDTVKEIGVSGTSKKEEEVKTTITNITPTAKVEIDTKVQENFVFQTTREIPIDMIVYDSNGSIMPNTLITITDGSLSNPESHIIFQQITNSQGYVGGSITVNTSIAQVEAIVSIGDTSSNPVPIPLLVKTCPVKENDDNGHGNDADGYDESNPGKSSGIEPGHTEKDSNKNSQDCKTSKGITKIGNITVPIDFNRVETKITDGDGDGVDDLMDFYPDNPNKASKIRFPAIGVNTISYEDLFPSAGDADLNDYTIQFYNEEDLNAKGEVVEIRGYYQHVAKGAGYNHTLNLRLSESAEIESFETEILDAKGSNTKTGKLIKSPTKEIIQDGFEILGDSSKTIPSKNSSTSDKYKAGYIAKVKVVFGRPLSKKALGSSPYDLFIKILSKKIPSGYPAEAPRSLSANPSYYEVHFPGKYFYPSGKDVYIDKNGFPWVIMVPGVWAWPFESQDIRKSGAYPKFNNWVSSKGSQDTDWYKDVDSTKVFAVASEPSRILLESGSGLLAYLNATTLEAKLLYLLLGVIFITGSTLIYRHKFMKIT